MTAPARPWRARDESGMALLVVLVLLLAVGTSSATFIWFMDQQQARAGNRYRSAAALNVAEAGIYRALSILEGTAPGGQLPGRAWRPQAYAESVPVGPLEGRYVLSISDDPAGGLIVTSTGEVSGAIRKLRARVHLAPPSLLAALFGTGIVKIDGPPSATFLLPYGYAPRNRPWVHVMAGREVWFAAARVVLNDPAVPFAPVPGPVDAVGELRDSGKPAVSPIRVVLGAGGLITVDLTHLPVDAGQLRAFGVPLQDVTTRPEGFSQVGIDRDFMAGLAGANRSNAAVNKAAGLYFGDAALEQKKDSLYSGADFAKVLTHLATEQHPSPLRGWVYVRGSVTIPTGGRLVIENGALVAESTVHVSPSAELAVIHSPSTRTLPGLIVLDHGRLTVAQMARLRVHGLIYANRTISAGEGAVVDVVSAVFGNDPGLSYITTGAIVMIRYDPAVLGTPGLLVADSDRAIAWIASWEEVP